MGCQARTAEAHPGENSLWQQSIDEEWSDYGLRQRLGIDLFGNPFGLKYWHSAYRDGEPGPFWSWQRFGRTSTKLDIFPHAFGLDCVICGSDVFIFGKCDWRQHPKRARKPIILGLDTSTYCIEGLLPEPSSVRLDL